MPGCKGCLLCLLGAKPRCCRCGGGKKNKKNCLTNYLHNKNLQSRIGRPMIQRLSQYVSACHPPAFSLSVSQLFSFSSVHYLCALCLSVITFISLVRSLSLPPFLLCLCHPLSISLSHKHTHMPQGKDHTHTAHAHTYNTLFILFAYCLSL